MRTRDEIAADILQKGILNARRALREGNSRQAVAELDHVHNLPRILTEPDDDELHRYYWKVEIPSYLSASQPKWPLFFEALWDELDKACRA